MKRRRRINREEEEKGKDMIGLIGAQRDVEETRDLKW